MRLPLTAFLMAAFASPALCADGEPEIRVMSEVPFVDGIYAKKEDCQRILDWGPSGRPNSIEKATWHLTPRGFTDAYEGACTFHTAFVKETTATVHAVCQEGAVTSLQIYYLEKTEGEKAPITVVHAFGVDAGGDEGAFFEYCMDLQTP